MPKLPLFKMRTRSNPPAKKLTKSPLGLTLDVLQILELEPANAPPTSVGIVCADVNVFAPNVANVAVLPGNVIVALPTVAVEGRLTDASAKSCNPVV